MYFVLFVLLIFIVVLLVRGGLIIYYNIKAHSVWKRYFLPDKLYSAKMVSAAFKIDKEHFHKLMKTLEEYNNFRTFEEDGVELVKEYYSSYELKYIIRKLIEKTNIRF